MRKLFAAALLLLACAGSSFAQSPVQQGMLEWGGKALDCANGTLALDTPTGSATQIWGLWGPPSGNTIWLLQCNGWQAIDFSKNPLIVGQVWDNPSSADSMLMIAAGPANSMSIYAQGQLMEPDPTGTTVVMGGPPAGWSWVQPPTQGPPPGTPPPSAWVPAGYVYQAAASDEFAPGDDITQKWWTRLGCSNSGGYPCDGTGQLIPSNGEQQLYSENGNHQIMSGGGVALTAYPPTSGNTSYASGMLRDKETFNFSSPSTGFYIEVSAKLPPAGTNGAWPAFWFGATPTSVNVPPWPPEMDVAEFALNPSFGGNDVGTIRMSVKFNGNYPGPWNGSGLGWGPVVPTGWTWCSSACYGDTQWDTPENLSTDYHTYAIWYTPGVAGVDPVNPATGLPTHHYAYYVDGFMALYGNYDFGEGADGTTGWNASLLLNLAVGGVEGGTPLASAYPASFDIQYVRVYTTPGGDADLVPSTIGQNFCPASGGC